MRLFQRRRWLWIAVNVAGLLAVLWTIHLIQRTPAQHGPYVFTGEATTRLVVFTGKSAFVFLVFTLACTPAARLLGWQQAITVRKSLGLWGFGFSLVHALLFIGGKAIFTTGEAWRYIGEVLPYALTPYFLKTPYARYGTMALLLLCPLALTSHRWAMRRLGKGWKRLHRLIYLAVPLALLHYWQRQLYLEQLSNSTEQPDYVQPVLFALLIGLLLLVRVPQIRRRTQQLYCG